MSQILFGGVGVALTSSSIDIDHIDPSRVVEAFGSYKIGMAEALKGEGHAADTRFYDFDTPWVREPVEVIKARFLKAVVKHIKRGRHNFIEMHGFPTIRYRDDGCGMIHWRIRPLYVRVHMAPRKTNG